MNFMVHIHNRDVEGQKPFLSTILKSVRKTVWGSGIETSHKGKVE